MNIAGFGISLQNEQNLAYFSTSKILRCFFIEG
ncbi:MAG: hypothetical protein ACI81T_003915, partial [Bacteroidia bacterium]